jgi:hypothetical protein
MIRRVLLMLLLAWLAVPATAMPVLHEAPAAQGASAHGCHDAPAPNHEGKPTQAMHGCIGCIAPLHGLERAASRGEPLRPLLRIPALAYFPAGAHTVPDPPPPRLTV